MAKTNTISNGVIKNAEHIPSDAKRFEAISTVVLGILAVVALLPIILIVITSFTDETTLLRNGYSFLPEVWSTDAYVYMLQQY